jgi:choline-sulfatase
MNAMTERRPNLLLIMSDQHTQKIAGCYGDRVIATPAIDRLARRGVVFDNAYTTSPICVPARMSALTARHAFRQDCWTNTDYLASDVPTFMHALGAAGYAPALVGRLHALGPDQLHGYATRAVGDHSPNWIGIKRHDMGVLTNTNEPERVSLTKSGPGRSAYELKDIDVTAAALAAIHALGARSGSARQEPFALTVGLMLPHAPFVAAPEDFMRYSDRVGRATLPPAGKAAEHPWIAWWRENREIIDVPAAEELRARAAYYGLVDRMDRMIGAILDALDAAGLADDTLVVYTSDHGEQLGERGLWWKHTFFDESVKVPMILAWPGKLPAGERRNQVVNLMDLAATMLDAVGAPALPDADGRSFLAVARDAGAPWVDETFAEYCTDETPAWTGGMAVRQRMIRAGRWKLSYYHGYRPQLFDLANDPHELNDLAQDAAHAGVGEALLGRVLAGWDPLEIDRRMRRRVMQKRVLGDWAAATRPKSAHLWEFSPEQNVLLPPP